MWLKVIHRLLPTGRVTELTSDDIFLRYLRWMNGFGYVMEFECLISITKRKV